MAKWQATKLPGVRVRESDSRRFQGKLEKYFTVRYTDNGKSVEEPVGWLSEGVTPAYCSQVRGQIVQNIRIGQGPQSLKEQRELEDTRATRIEQMVTQYYATRRGWVGLQPTIEQASSLYGWLIVVRDMEGHILADSHLGVGPSGIVSGSGR